jgi:hypothetical protein
LKVEGPKSTGAAAPASRARATGGASGASGKFSAELDKVTGGAESGAAPVGGTTGVIGVGGILAAQTATDQDQNPSERRRRAQRGYELLDRLEELRRGLLLGHIPKDKLADLVRMVRDRRDKGADPVVASLLAEIELRASVELAKLGLPAG